MSTNVKITISAVDKASALIQNVTSQLQSLQSVAKQMSNINLSAANINNKEAALTPFSGYMKGIYSFEDITDKEWVNAFYKAQNAASGVTQQTEKISNNTQKAASNTSLFGKGLLNISSKMYLVKRASSLIADFVSESGSWIENLNLFSVTFGDAYDRAIAFAQKLSTAFGISMNEIIKYTGLFKQMSEAIGVAEETSTQMSMALTALGYDLASFYNITTDAAMEKIRAGIAGQTKPLRQLGMDITAQSLDKYLSERLDLKYTSKQLNQSDKVILRTIIMLEQAKNAYGDMANTVNTYSNQMKVLKGSVDNLKLAIGDFLVSPATNVVQYINGMIIALTQLLRVFVPLNKTNVFTSISDGATGADEDIEDLNKTINNLSFDKFESLSSKNKYTSLTDILTDEFYKQQEEYMKVFNARLEEIENNANNVANALLGIVFPDYKKWIEDPKNAGKAFSDWTAEMEAAGTPLNNIGNLTSELSGNVKTLIDLIKAAAVAWASLKISSWITGLKALTSTAMTTQIAMAALVAGFMLLVYFVSLAANSWDDMSSWQQAITIIGALAAALLIGAAAWAAFHGAWTAGAAIPAIIGGLVAAGAAIALFSSQAKSTASQFKVSAFADGGVPERGSMFIAGESGAELVYNMPGGSTGVSNVEQLREATKGALADVVAPFLQSILSEIISKPQGGGDLILDGQKLTKSVYKEGVRAGYWKR